VSKRGALRASDSDREQVVERLHQAATEGRIVSDELEHRVSAALKARTYDELDATVADLPGPRSRGRVPARRTVPQFALSAVRANPWLIVFAIPALAVTAAMLVAAAVLWIALAVVVMIVGGHPGRRGLGPGSRSHRPGLRSARRGPGSYWA
jgi:hypothetical protein